MQKAIGQLVTTVGQLGGMHCARLPAWPWDSLHCLCSRLPLPQPALRHLQEQKECFMCEPGHHNSSSYEASPGICQPHLQMQSPSAGVQGHLLPASER